MSFINIEAPKGKKFKRAKIICPYCRDESLDLKWRGINSQGRKEFTDISTDSLHLCKIKAPVVEERKPTWGEKSYTPLGHFWNEVVIHGDETPEELGKKLEFQERMVGWDGQTTDLQRYFRDLDPKLKEKYAAEDKKWLEHDFNTVKKKWKVSK